MKSRKKLGNREKKIRIKKSRKYFGIKKNMSEKTISESGNVLLREL